MENRIDIEAFYAGLDEMFKKSNGAEIGSYMESWLKDAELKNDVAGIIAVSNELGGLRRAMGENGKAKELYISVLEKLELIGMKDTENYAAALINMGDVYVYTGEHKEALDIFLRARKILQDKKLTGDYRMAALCNNISMVYREFGNFSEAEEALDVAFNIIKGLSEYRSELATTYVNLGELQVRQNKLTMARESFLAAIKIYEGNTQGKDVHHSAACAGMGEVCFLNSEYEESENWYKQALNLIERDFGKTDYYRLIENNLKKVQSAR
ncbi:MAG: tetratricopeptide repeat protein [Eubacteriales bacterium]